MILPDPNQTTEEFKQFIKSLPMYPYRGTTANTDETLRSEVVRLLNEVEKISKKLIVAETALEWLEKQEAVMTPKMIWFRESDKTLREVVIKQVVLEELRAE